MDLLWTAVYTPADFWTTSRPKFKTSLEETMNAVLQNVWYVNWHTLEGVSIKL